MKSFQHWTFAKALLLLAVACAFLLPGASARAQSPDTAALNSRDAFPGGQSEVDWKQGFIEITAWGSADTRETVNRAQAKTIALKTARHLAYEKAAERVFGLSLNSESIYGNEMLVNSHLMTSTSGVIRNAAVVHENVTIGSDGAPWAEVSIRVPLSGEHGLSGPVARWAIGPEVSGDAFEPPAEAVAPAEASVTTPYTGLIVDASGLSARPAMVVRVLAGNDLRSVYGPHVVDQTAAMNNGFAAYASSMDEAVGIDRAGDNPLLIKAQSVAGSNRADLVISSQDAARLYAADLQGGFLKQCRVVVVIN
jgi:hypothetical protein